MIKRFLVVLDNSEYSDSVINFACKIAKNNDAELSGIIVLDVPGIMKSIRAVPVGGSSFARRILKKKMVSATQINNQLAEKFKSICEENGVNFKLLEYHGCPAKEIINESFYHDMVLAGGKTTITTRSQHSGGKTICKVLNHLASPVLMIPERSEFLKDSKVVIFFDGLLASMSALQNFVRLVKDSSFDITIVNTAKSEEVGVKILARAEAYLKTYGFTKIKKELIVGSIHDVVEKDYVIAADIVVLGAHVNRGIFEFTRKSLSKYLVEQGNHKILVGQLNDFKSLF